MMRRSNWGGRGKKVQAQECSKFDGAKMAIHDRNPRECFIDFEKLGDKVRAAGGGGKRFRQKRSRAAPDVLGGARSIQLKKKKGNTWDH